MLNGAVSSFKILNDLFGQVIEECNGHLLHLQPLMRKIQEHENKLKDNRRSEDEMELSEDERRKSEAEKIVIQTAMKSDQFGALIHHLSLVRNKRCLMAYVYNRAEVIRSLGWVVDCVLPEEIEEKLSSSEKEYFKNHAATLQSYMSELDLDLSVDMIPPKDPYIKVRVLEDIGEVVLSDQVANLARHAMLFLRRTDAEQYISQGLMEELTG
ncbi:probable DNA replication complex GINS protein PSF1 isoform X3 [Olea europaea var. sylvestris]|uniref:probable DNA replication complex GINS protein PSF1 isoform X3 n=1 Tax=Olea europaea var. sylvestris TaxID=158386 RepID=UPI000C1D4D4C|nr:probable DNA replication complex GINS protein PSF1 isoform X3 [Olea europaea var. sylvestris]